MHSFYSAKINFNVQVEDTQALPALKEILGDDQKPTQLKPKSVILRGKLFIPLSFLETKQITGWNWLTKDWQGDPLPTQLCHKFQTYADIPYC